MNCIQYINNAFEKYERSFNVAAIKIASGKFEKSLHQRGNELVWKDDGDFNYRSRFASPVAGLHKMYSEVRVRLKDEIETKWFDHDDNYFRFIDHRMSYHFNFIKKNCNDVLSLYVLKRDEANNLINRIRKTETELFREEFLSAMKLDLVNIFEEIENLIAGSYPGYLKKMKIFLRGTNPILSNPIYLDYGSKNDEVLKLLYDGLNSEFIDEDFISFSNHFRQVDIELPKIKWRGKQSILVAVFNNRNIKGKEESLTGISLRNHYVPELLAEHFYIENNKDLNVNSMEKQMHYQTKDRGVPGMDDLRVILLKIKSYKNK